MIIRSSLVLLSTVLPLAAQGEDVVVASTVKVSEATFYQAFFLDNDQSQSAEATKKALGLYTSFLAANPKHDLAPKAAHRAVVLMYATGDLSGARTFAKAHDALITKAEGSVRQSRQDRPAGNEEVATKLREAMQAARTDGNTAEAGRIMEAMRRSGGARGARGAGRGGFGAGQRGQRGQRGNRGGRGGGASIPQIADMKQEDAKKSIQTLATSMERMIDLMAQTGQADKADKLEAKLDKVQDLVDEGKMGDAQKVLDSMKEEMGSMGRGGRGGRGGEQGGRRRGGDAGGTGTEEGGERRRRR